VPLSDGSSEFGERGRDAQGSGVAPEFAVTAANVLHERVTTDDHPGSVVAFESAHRPEPRFEAAVVGFAVVRVLLGVMERRRDQLIDHRAERRGPVGHDLDRLTMSTECSLKELVCRSGVTSRRHVDINDVAVLVDGSVHVAPPARDLDVGLIHEPAVADRVSARTGRIREQRREALHPPEHADVIDLDTTLSQQLLEIAIRQPVAQVPTHREDNDLRREPENP
jgi:hypothetical protein